MALRLKANRRFPSLPNVVDTPENHTQVLMAVKEALDIGQRRTGDLANSFIRVQDLIDLGLITIEGNTNAIVGADLSEIADIGDLSGAATGDFLRFDGTVWVNDQLSPTDITTSMVVQHQAALTITWGQITGEPTIPSTLDDLSDVAITSPNVNDVLTWNGSAWVDAPGGGSSSQYLDDLLDVDALYPSVGDALIWDGTNWVNSSQLSISDEIAADSPMAWWRCDESSGTLADSSGNSYTLTFTGSPNYQRASIVLSSETKHLRIPGGTVYAARAGTLGFTTPINTYSVEAVVRMEESNGAENHRIFVLSASGETEAANYQIYVFVSPSGALGVFWEYGAGTNFTFQSDKSALPKGVPFHLAWTKNLSTRTIKVYINGALVDQGTWISSQDTTGGSSCTSSIGDQFGGGSSGFSIAHLAVYSSVLSDDRIREHARAGGFRST